MCPENDYHVILMPLLLAFLVGIACATAMMALCPKLQILLRLLPWKSQEKPVHAVKLSWIDRVLGARRLNKLRAQLPETLGALSTSVRAGLSLQQAVQAASAQMTGPAGEELRHIWGDTSLGGTLDGALTSFESRVPLPEVKLLVAGLKLARTTGGSLAPLLDRIAETLREREQMRGQVRVLTAQGRLSGWVVGATPLVLMGLISLIDPAFLRPLWTTGAGWMILAAAAVLETLGILGVRAVVRIDP